MCNEYSTYFSSTDMHVDIGSTQSSYDKSDLINLQKEQRKRQHLIEEYCKNSGYPAGNKLTGDVFLDSKNEVIWCKIPKVASTSLSELFFKQANPDLTGVIEEAVKTQGMGEGVFHTGFFIDTKYHVRMLKTQDSKTLQKFKYKRPRWNQPSLHI